MVGGGVLICLEKGESDSERGVPGEGEVGERMPVLEYLGCEKLGERSATQASSLSISNIVSSRIRVKGEMSIENRVEKYWSRD